MAGQLSAATSTGSTRQIVALCRHLEFFAEHPPYTVTPLANGALNLNYRVETRRGTYVVRRYPESSSGICRQQELRCQHAAAVAGIAPAPLCLNNHQQVLISEFIPDGEPFVASTQSIPALALTLARLHQLPVQTAVLQPASYLQQLARPLNLAVNTADAVLLGNLITAAKNYQSLSIDPVLCHLDLHAGNILWAEQRVWLLDFEFAQRADSFLDLAAFILHFQLPEPAEQQLLTAYWQHRAKPQVTPEHLSAKLLLAKTVFSGFCWLWYQSLQHQPFACSAQASYWQQQVRQLLQLQTA